jgi:RNA polymerase sigma-70 factor (ECF subfamily)
MWPDASETQQLLVAIQGGDRGAVDRLFERHRDAVRRMIELRLDRAVAARVDASDVVQETLLEASRRLAEYVKDPAMPFHLWIRHIARDRVIDAHRRHRAAGRRSVDREQRLEALPCSSQSSIQLLHQLQAEGLTPAAQAIRAEMLQRFELALGEMGEDDREILLMRHVEQLSNQEVARALELTEPAASMRYLRALRRLRELLGEEGSSAV